jgi:hypothetical protein
MTKREGQAARDCRSLHNEQFLVCAFHQMLSGSCEVKGGCYGRALSGLGIAEMRHACTFFFKSWKVAFFKWPLKK